MGGGPNTVSLQIVATKCEKPIGDQDSTNLLFQTSKKFDPESVKIYLSGLLLDNNDYELKPDQKSFEILLDPDDGKKLNCPPLQGEPFNIIYNLC